MDQICDVLEKLVGIDILASLNKSETELKVKNLKKGKKREVVELDNKGEKTERTEDQMEGIEERSQKEVFSSLIFS